MRQRWLVFAAAAAGTAVLATAFAVAADRAVARGGPAPHLATISDATVRNAGFSLAPAAVPLHCAAVEAAASRHWLPSAAAGCPMSREAAIVAAARGTVPHVREALLARVSSTRSGPVGQDRLAWLVVLQPSAAILPKFVCASPAADRPCPPGTTAAPAAVAIVDAHVGQVLEVVSMGRWGPIGPWQPGPVSPPPIITLPSRPVEKAPPD